MSARALVLSAAVGTLGGAIAAVIWRTIGGGIGAVIGVAIWCGAVAAVWWRPWGGIVGVIVGAIIGAFWDAVGLAHPDPVAMAIGGGVGAAIGVIQISRNDST